MYSQTSTPHNWTFRSEVLHKRHTPNRNTQQLLPLGKSWPKWGHSVVPPTWLLGPSVNHLWRQISRQYDQQSVYISPNQCSGYNKMLNLLYSKKCYVSSGCLVTAMVRRSSAPFSVNTTYSRIYPSSAGTPAWQALHTDPPSLTHQTFKESKVIKRDPTNLIRYRSQH